jgi:toxin-antitoxin system PIN domain toxin
MISFDTNILFPACDSSSPLHPKACEYLGQLGRSENVCVCEQVLMELYCLLRNPTVCANPLPAMEAVHVIHRFRSNPRWRLVDVLQSPALMEHVWSLASKQGFAYRRIFDIRLAETLRQHGVREFATRNTKDFRDAGFARVWNPLA